jgi:RNA polymerase sigma-70 factor (ECF subfamily)
MRAYSPELYRYAYWLCRDSFQAEDLLQETFMRAWKSWDDLRDESAARSWLYTILRNERARLYERKRFKIDDDQDLNEVPDPRVGVADELEMRDALRALPPGYREPLLLQWIGGYSCREIAEIMNLTEGAVMTRLTRARIALRGADEAPRKLEGVAR